MTGFPDLTGGDPEVPGPDEPLLRQPPGYLPPPPGAFGHIRRRAARRRRLRTAGGGLAAAAVLSGSLYLVGALGPRGGHDTVSPPATNSLTSPAPRTVTPMPPGPTSPAAPSATPSARRGGDTPSPGASTGPATTTGTPAPDDGTATRGGSTPMCAASQLTAALGGSDAGAGNLYRYLLLTNHGSTACHLTGYPGVSLLDAGGKRIGTPADRQAMGYSQVVLGPGQTASDTIHTANRMGTCWAASAKVRIYPPGSKQWLDVPGEVTICSDLFTITPLTAGRTGNPPG
ncbi:DUF4232 domain-containing protein [Actinacidiphila epipremni]|uniref:DUF4232 domain-containing protein n=1 Tax=Actinacidiphila epipremni TaxID=2053013 RepID=A0ABX1A0Y7_9ACTN|nr:DUF4232 domain-containing protein [Actinacidiphila epipremni]NJP47288.1 DUF4232 domain-containing protein [Actinacidiphila epipremni]